MSIDGLVNEDPGDWIRSVHHEYPREAGQIQVENADVQANDGDQSDGAAREAREVMASMSHQCPLCGPGAAARRCRRAEFTRDHPRGPATSQRKENARERPLPAREISEPFLLQPVGEARRSLARCATHQPASQRQIPCYRSAACLLLRPVIAKRLPAHAGTPLPKLAKISLARARPLGVRR